MNQKAFNLFTALVSFVLIMLTMLLINSMTETESSTIATINDISAQAQMQTAADLARADAIQLFNYGLRFRIEDWLSRPTNWYPLYANKKWSEIKKDYACVNFGGCAGANSGVQFANITAETMMGILEVGQSFGRYEINLEKDETSLREALQTIVGASVDSGEFFEVVGCNLPETKFRTAEDSEIEQKIRDCTGTFYVKLKMGMIDDATYEKLPRIVVVNSATGDYLKEGILPHADFRIYVPLRIFKAIAQAKYYADTQLFEQNDYFKSIALGMCDAVKCAPRKDGLGTATDAKIADSACPSTPNDPLSSASIPGLDAGKAKVKAWNATAKGKGKGGVDVSITYNADDVGDIQEKLKMLLITELCYSADLPGALDLDPNDNLELVQDADACNVYSTDITPEVFAAKTIKFGVPFTDPKFDATAYCARAKELKAKLLFEENDPAYKVNKNNNSVYTIELVDSYSPNIANTGTCYTKCNSGTDLAGCGSFRCDTS